MKKENFKYIISSLILLLIASVVFVSISQPKVYAENETIEQEETVEQETPTLFSRIEEKLPVLLGGASVSIGGVLAGFLVALWKRRKKDSDTVQANTLTVDGAIDTLNKIITAINGLKEIIENSENLNTKRDDEVSILKTELNSMLEILKIVYTSSNLPQATKDLVNMNYVKAITASNSLNEKQSKIE